METNLDQYILIAKEIIKRITNAGGEAYIVGSSLCLIVTGQDAELIQIYTNLSVGEFKELFKENKVTQLDDNNYLLIFSSKKFLISYALDYTFTKKLNIIESRKHYSSTLMTFIKTQDYSCCAMAMGINNIVYDCYKGKEDILKKRLKSIYFNPRVLYDNIPRKILDGLEIISQLGYKPDHKIVSGMRAKAHKLKQIDKKTIIAFIAHIYNSKYFRKVMKYVYKTNVYKYTPFKNEIKFLCKNYRKEDYDIFAALNIVRKKEYNNDIGDLMPNPYDFQLLCNLAITNPKAEYDTMTLFTFGLDKCVKANYINYLLGRCKKKGKLITKQFNALPIKKPCDLAFKGQDVLDMTQNATEYIDEIMDEVISSILAGNLKNEYEAIRTFIRVKLFEKGISEVSFNTQSIKTQTNTVEEVFDASKKDDEELQKLRTNQEALLKRVLELEVQGLKKELDNEIERKIKESGILDEVPQEMKEKTHSTLYKVYYDSLISTEKYSKIKEINNG